MAKIRTVKDIVDWRLCLGCGACAPICPEAKIQLFDVLDEGVRPVVANDQCAGCTACLDVCPAYESDHREAMARPGIVPALADLFGPVLEVWEGYATDREIRHRGASGGLITALALFCLEKEKMHGVLHTGGDPAHPIRNKTRLSRSRQDLLSCTGSRYSPASVCDGLGLISNAPAPCAFIGQPSEVTALRKAQKLSGALDQNVGLVISFFCAGSPSTRGTMELLKSRGYDPAEVEELRYRGLGWPGMFAVRRKNEEKLTPLMTYKESWGFLQKFRPFSLHLCPDSSGEDADISCADPWYREIQPGEEGFSLVVVRTERGRQLLQRAQAAGQVQLTRVDPLMVVKAQRALAAKRGAIWGRILTMRLLRLPAPRLKGYFLFSSWLRSPAREKMKSMLGTLRRIRERNYFQRAKLHADAMVPLAGKGETPLPSVKKNSTTGNKLTRVCLMGASMATGNRGVSALAASMVKLVKQAVPHAEPMFLLGLNRPRVFEAWLGDATCRVPTVNFRMSPKAPPSQQMGLILVFSALYGTICLPHLRNWILRRFPWIKAVAEADFVGDIRGGDSFSDIYGLKRFIISSLPIISVIWIRGRISLMPQTYGPFKTSTARRLARYILRHADPVIARDRQGAETVREVLGADRDVWFSPDVAFALPARLPANIPAEPPLLGIERKELVGINVNGLMYNGGYTRNNMFGLKLDYPQYLVKLVESLLEDSSRHVLLVPHTFAPPGSVESDPEGCAKLRQQIPAALQSRVHVLQGEYDQSEIKGIIGTCDFFIGSRMHSCIAALSQGIPTVGVAYSKKFRGVFETVGGEDWVIDGREVTVEQAIKSTMEIFRKRETIRPSLAIQARQAREQLEEFFRRMLAPGQSGNNQNGERSKPAAPSADENVRGGTRVADKAAEVCAR